MYQPKELTRYQFVQDNQALFDKGKINIKALNKSNNQIENIQLIPFGKTILRQVSF
jgi:hypothetical protein